MLERPLTAGEADLYRAFSRLAARGNYTNDQVIGAAANLVIESIRQGYWRREAAETFYEALSGRMKQKLLSHYVWGGRRSALTFAQVMKGLSR